jgi:class 3 adenylate cyclase
LTGERAERRLAAVLAADVAEYSRLMGSNEEGTLARLKVVRKTLVDPAIASHRGRIVKTTGDGRERANQKPSDRLDSYDHYLRAVRSRWSRLDRQGQAEKTTPSDIFKRVLGKW